MCDTFSVESYPATESCFPCLEDIKTYLVGGVSGSRLSTGCTLPVVQVCANKPDGNDTAGSQLLSGIPDLQNFDIIIGLIRGKYV